MHLLTTASKTQEKRTSSVALLALGPSGIRGQHEELRLGTGPSTSSPTPNAPRSVKAPSDWGRARGSEDPWWDNSAVCWIPLETSPRGAPSRPQGLPGRPNLGKTSRLEVRAEKDPSLANYGKTPMVWIRAGLARRTPGSSSVSLPPVTTGEIGCCEGLISAKRTFGIVLQLLLERAGEEELSCVASSVTTQGGHFSGVLARLVSTPLAGMSRAFWIARVARSVWESAGTCRGCRSRSFFRLVQAIQGS